MESERREKELSPITMERMHQERMRADSEAIFNGGARFNPQNGQLQVSDDYQSKLKKRLEVESNLFQEYPEEYEYVTLLRDAVYFFKKIYPLNPRGFTRDATGEIFSGAFELRGNYIAANKENVLNDLQDIEKRFKNIAKTPDQKEIFDNLSSGFQTVVDSIHHDNLDLKTLRQLYGEIDDLLRDAEQNLENYLRSQLKT